VVAGALRSYLEPRGLLPGEPLVAGVPLALRDEADERANAITSVAVSLATDVADPIARLVAIRDAMTVQKRRRHRTLGEDLAAWADVPPPVVFSWLARAYVDLDLEARMDPIVNLIVSSVPGPPRALYLAGARLAGIHPLGPIFSGMALNVTAIGCGDAVDVGLVACRKRLPDLWELARALPDALRELRPAAAEATGAGAR
jgi:diacylglycerol O-acyltransferase